jgi:hypothetical protein
MPGEIFNHPKTNRGKKMDLKSAVKSQTVVSRYKDLFSMLGVGAYNGTAEFLQYELYDRVTITSQDVTDTKKEYVFFNGTAGTTKTLADTNLEGSRQIPQGQHFEARAITLQITKQSDTPPAEGEVEALLRWLDNAVLSVGIANKAPMLQATVSRVLGMSLIAIATGSTTTSDSTFRQISNGVYVLNIPIVFPALTSFDVKMICANAPASGQVGWSIRFGFQTAMIRGL